MRQPDASRHADQALEKAPSVRLTAVELRLRDGTGRLRVCRIPTLSDRPKRTEAM
jgi:hypothetical protein